MDLKATPEAIFTINGKVYRAGADIPASTSLNTFIRNHALLSGTKFMCKEGSCGSCVVNLKYTDYTTQKLVTVAVNSCLMPVLACHGCAVTTVEGIGSRARGYNKVQTTLAHFSGTQCGYCSPGVVMSMFSLLDSNPNATVLDVENNFSGNLCRCTGYRPILDAFKSLASNPPTKLKQRLLEIEEAHMLCPNKGKCSDPSDEDRCKTCMMETDKDNFELDFSELNLSQEYFHLQGINSEWYRAGSVKEILEIFDQIGSKSYMLLAGNTARGVKKPATEPDVYIDINNVVDLKGVQLSSSSITFGSLTRLFEYINTLKTLAQNQPNTFRYAAQIADHISLVANVPVRNRATLGGNLGLTNNYQGFPSDVFLLLDAVGAQITLVGISGMVSVVTPTQLRAMDLNKNIITKITLPALNSTTILMSYKIMPVSLSAVAIVNAGFLYDIANNGALNKTPSIVLSGINSKFRHATNTEQFLTGKNLFNNVVLSHAVSTLWNELQPDNSDLTNFSPAYRKLLGTSLFYKSVLSLAGNLVHPRLRSGGPILVRPISSGKQTYQTDAGEYPLTQAIPKLEAQIQCSGEAKYVNDLQILKNELAAQLVLAKQFADIASIDPSPALKIPGVVAFFSANDIPGKNNIGFPFVNYFTGNTELFSSGTINYWGQPVGMIVATTSDIAELAVDYVKITYKEAKVPLLSIKEVLNSKEKDKRVVLQQNQSATVPGVGGIYEFKGEIETTLGGQYAHTMETNVCRVQPQEDGQYKVHVATQTITSTKAVIAQVMGVPLNKIDCIVPRVGGSFGSKNTSHLYAASSCTLASSILQAPVRMVMTVPSEMDAIGKRTPFYTTYKGRADVLGIIQGLDLNIYIEYGYTVIMDVFAAVVPCIINYFNPLTWNINIYNVFTDKTPHLILRGPGFMEAISTIEQIMDHVAFVSKLDPTVIRITNTLDPIMSAYIIDWRKKTDFDTRKLAIDKFNAENRWKKKGIALTAARYPFEYLGDQIGCTVSILYPDGTIQIQHGGVEMCQGINTKVAQAVAFELKRPLHSIQVKHTTSLNCPNATPTWGSFGSEIVVEAAVNCCRDLNLALAPVKLLLINPTWEQLISKAWETGVPLTSTKPSGILPYLKQGIYFVYAVAVTEVEMDVLTGQQQITRVDILEDVGKSMSPEVDVGQIEGAFIMALGLFTGERLVYDPKTGALLTDRLWHYHIPRTKDIPIDFRITFVPNSTNPVGVLNSKGAGVLYR